jgi:hypothetical protein
MLSEKQAYGITISKHFVLKIPTISIEQAQRFSNIIYNCKETGLSFVL